MGNRGPQKTPTAVLKARGSWRAVVRKDEPALSPSLPKCPRWLNDDAKKFWKKIAPHVFNMGIMTDADEFQLALLCDQAVFYQKASEDRDMGACTKILPSLMKLCGKFGLSPSDRAGLAVGPPKKQEDSKSRFFGEAV